MTTTTPTAPTKPLTARAIVQIVSVKLRRDDAGARVADLRLRHLQSGKVLSATAEGEGLIKTIFDLGNATPWSVLVDKTIPTAMRLVSARVASA